MENQKRPSLILRIQPAPNSLDSARSIINRDTENISDPAESTMIHAAIFTFLLTSISGEWSYHQKIDFRNRRTQICAESELINPKDSIHYSTLIRSYYALALEGLNEVGKRKIGNDVDLYLALERLCSENIQSSEIRLPIQNTLEALAQVRKLCPICTLFTKKSNTFLGLSLQETSMFLKPESKVAVSAFYSLQRLDLNRGIPKHLDSIIFHLELYSPPERSYLDLAKKAGGTIEYPLFKLYSSILDSASLSGPSFPGIMKFAKIYSKFGKDAQFRDSLLRILHRKFSK